MHSTRLLSRKQAAAKKDSLLRADWLKKKKEKKTLRCSWNSPSSTSFNCCRRKARLASQRMHTSTHSKKVNAKKKKGKKEKKAFEPAGPAARARILAIHVCVYCSVSLAARSRRLFRPMPRSREQQQQPQWAAASSRLHSPMCRVVHVLSIYQSINLSSPSLPPPSPLAPPPSPHPLNTRRSTPAGSVVIHVSSSGQRAWHQDSGGAAAIFFLLGSCPKRWLVG